MLKEELEFLANMMLGDYTMSWRRIEFQERHPYFGWTCYESPAGNRFGADPYGQRDAASEIADIAQKGIDCRIVLPDLIRCLERGNPWPVEFHAARAIAQMVSAGTDCSCAVPALRKCTERPTCDYGDVRSEVEMALDAIEGCSQNEPMKLRHALDFMKARIAGVTKRLEPLGLGDAGRVVIVDGNTSQIYVLFGRRGFNLFAAPSSISVYPSSILSMLKTNTLAYSCAGRFHSLIVLLNGKVPPDSTEFEGTMIHELTHLSKRVRRCLSTLRKKWRAQKANADACTYLSRIVDEGFANFVSALLINPSSLHEVADSGERAKAMIQQVKAEAASSYGGWSSVNEKIKDHAHALGDNFFLHTRAILQHSDPADYIEHLCNLPPTVEELLSVDGGRQWATRVEQSGKAV